MLKSPPYVIKTPRLILRCWAPRDARLLKEAVDRSVEHLLPWMPWARDEPRPLEAKVQLIKQFRSKFDLDQDYTYGIFNREETLVLGGCGLHTRQGEHAYEIGYWIDRDARGQGLATETAKALTIAGFLVAGIDRIEIHCDVDNRASARIPEKLGYIHEATLRRRLVGTLEPGYRDKMVWILFRDVYEKSGLTLEMECLDACEQPVP